MLQSTAQTPRQRCAERVAGLLLVIVLSLVCGATPPHVGPGPRAIPGPPGERAIMVTPPSSHPPVNIILFIGDGMGEGQLTAARWSAYGYNGALAVDTMPYHGWSHTSPALGNITDSAAGATALATGIKTNNGMISMDIMLNALPTILERARARGMAVGLVTTTEIAHATPAAFATHAPLRTQMIEIARQMVERQIDVLLGGGEDDFLPSSVTRCFSTPGKRLDNRDLIREAIATGSTYVCDAAGLAAVPDNTPRLLGLFDDAGMTRPHSPTLAAMTQAAIRILDQDPEGFFLMVEGGQIDWASHDNDTDNVIGDTLALDEAVAVAMTYAEQKPNTLIIVTADHETGGMQVARAPVDPPGANETHTMPNGDTFYVSWSSDDHTAIPVPVMAQGPQAYLLEGRYENTHVYEVMHRALFNWRIDVPPVRMRQP